MKKKVVVIIVVAGVVILGTVAGGIWIVKRNDEVFEQRVEEERTNWQDVEQVDINNALADGNYGRVQEIIDDNLSIATNSGDEQFVFDVKMQQVILYFRMREWDKARNLIGELSEDVDSNSENGLLLKQYLSLIERLSNDS